MVSVTRRIKEVTQPRGGYIPPRLLTVTEFGLNSLAEVDPKAENVHPSIIGLAVDYVTRLVNGAQPEDVFLVSMAGAMKLGMFEEASLDLMSLDPGVLDEQVIAAACRLSGYDVGFRNSLSLYNSDAITTPDEVTSNHIRTMVIRSLNFFQAVGPVVLDGPTFLGGYTTLVTSGDGDFVTADTVWDFKVSVAPPTNKHTLQLLVYYLLGKRSIHPEFKSVTHIGVFNPRLNTSYRVAVTALPSAVVQEVARDVLGVVEEA